MEQNKIICPNCGAENEYGGTCQYCGSPLSNSSSGIIISETFDDDKRFIEDKYGLFIQRHDKFLNTTQSLLDNKDRIHDNKDRTHLNFVRIVHSNGNKKDYLRINCEHVQEPMLLLDDRKKIILEHHNSKEIGPYDYYISKDLLYEICHCYKIEGRIIGRDENLSYIIPRAQLYYNRVYDNAEFTDIYEKALKNKADDYRRLIYQLRKEKYNKIIGNTETTFIFGSRDIVLRFEPDNVNALYINGQMISWAIRDNFEISNCRFRRSKININKSILEALCKANSIEIGYRKDILGPFDIVDVTYYIKSLACVVYDEQYEKKYEKSLNDKSLDELYDIIQIEREELMKEVKKRKEEEKKRKEEEKKKEEDNKVIEEERLARRRKQYKLKGKIYLVVIFVGLSLIIKGVSQLPFDFKYLGIGLFIDIWFVLLWLNWHDDNFKYQ